MYQSAANYFHDCLDIHIRNKHLDRWFIAPNAITIYAAMSSTTKWVAMFSLVIMPCTL